MINIAKEISKLRYGYLPSSLLVFFFKPLHSAALFIGRLIQRKIKVNGRKVIINNVEISFPKNVGINIQSNIYWQGLDGFEPLTTKTLLLFFKKAEVFLDIGSNFGFYSVLAQKVNPKIETLCFEPLPHIYNDNIKFHQSNRTTKQLIINEAISNSAGNVKFYVPNVYSIASEITSASIEKDFSYNQSFSQSEIVVRATTLDSKIDELNRWKNEFMIIKVDVEGHENSVFEGGNNFFKAFRPIMIVEIDKNPSKRLLFFDSINKLNYLLFAITPMGYFNLDRPSLGDYNGARDFLLIPNEKVGKKKYYSFQDLVNI
jgi:FkbM family methyltransferase